MASEIFNSGAPDTPPQPEMTYSEALVFKDAGGDGRRDILTSDKGWVRVDTLYADQQAALVERKPNYAPS